jgi:hypothetical protein
MNRRTSLDLFNNPVGYFTSPCVNFVGGFLAKGFGLGREIAFFSGICLTRLPMVSRNIRK